MSNWKKELLALEQEYSSMQIETSKDLEAELVKRKIDLAKSSVVKPTESTWSSRLIKKVFPPPRKLIVSRQHARFLANVARVLYQHNKEEKNKQQAIEQVRVDQTAFAIQPGSTEHYIQQALLATPSGLKIGELIEQIEAAGWVSESKYHRYSAVNKALRMHYYMFATVKSKKDAVSKYKLRPAFKPTNRTERRIPVAPTHSTEHLTSIPTLKDVIVDIVKENRSGSYPSKVWNILQRMGYANVSYKSVYAAMQDPKRFVRNGFEYELSTKQ